MSKIIKKRILPMLLTLSIVMSMLGVLPIGVFALEQEQQSGDYTFVELNGNFCAITKYNGSDSEVTIPSTLDGLMVQKISSGAFKNNTTLERVVLSEYIEAVESEVFRGCTNLTSATLDNALSVVDSYMFYGCTSLTEVTIPSGVTTIGGYAFSGCTGLTEVNLPESLTTINAYAFENCQFESIDIPDSVTAIASKAFNNCTKLSEIGYPASWTRVLDYNYNSTDYSDGNSWYRTPFDGCTSLKSITVDEGVTSIPKHAFRYQTSLEEVIFPNSLTNIGVYAFDGCKGLKSISLPNNVTKINSYAFNGCSGITNVVLSSSLNTISSNAFSGCSGITNISLPGSLTTIGTYAFSNCTGLKTITIPESITVIQSGVFNNCTGLTEVNLPNTLTTINAYAFENCQFESIDIPDSVTAIASKAFNNCTKLSEIGYPASWTRVLDYNYNSTDYSDGNSWYRTPFDGCTSLKSITVDEGVTSIPKHAFRYQTSLEEVIFPNSLTNIGVYAFDGCKGLKSISLPNNVTKINSYAFNGCSGITNVVLSSSLNTISSNAFSGCSGITNISLPGSLTTIGTYAFSNCTGLKTITIPESITVIQSGVFNNCTGLTEVNLPNTLTTINAYAFENCQFESIDIPDSVTAIASKAFNNCTKLSEIGYPASWTRVLDYNYNSTDYSDGNSWYRTPFDGCTSLKSITVDEGVTSIPKHAFRYQTSLEEVILPNSLTSIGVYAFDGCNKLEKVWVPASVVTINNYAFNGCSSLTIHGVDGSYAQNFAETNSIPFSTESIVYERATISGKVIDEDGKGLPNVTVIFYDKTKGRIVSGLRKTNSDGIWSYDKAIVGCKYSISFSHKYYAINGTQEVLVSANGNTLSSVNAVRMMEEITTPETDFTYSALNGTYCTITGYTGTATEIVIPSEINGYTVQKISDNAFKNNKTIVNVVLPDNLETVGSSVFYGCTNLTYVGFNSGLTNIGSNMFHGCTNLANINLPNTLTTINAYAFENCQFESIDIPDSVTAIASKAFNNCTKLSEIGYPASWTRVLDYNYNSTDYSDGNSWYRTPFDGCTSLKSITVDEGVTSIPKHAFRYQTSLEEVILPNSLTNIGVYAFDGCKGLKSISLPNNVTKINSYAFNGCSGITNVVLSSSLNTISSNAFSGCSGITNISLPGSLTTIGTYAFSNCIGLKTIKIPESITVIQSGVFNNCTGLTEVNLPNTLTTINAYAFENCQFESIDIPDSVTAIASKAFNNCTKLSEIGYPASWTRVLDYNYNSTDYSDGNSWYRTPFDGCTSLKSITVDEGVTSIPKHAFRYQTSLEEVIFPNSLTNIGVYAFDGCKGLKSISLPNNVTKINSYAFNGCSGITNVVLSSSLNTISSNAFSGCSGITNISLPGSLTTIGTYAFSNCTGLKTITIPESITVIQSGVFNNCTGLTEVNLPNTLTTINAYAFENCQFESIDIPDSVTAIASKAFNNCTKLSEIGYPASWTRVLDYNYNSTDYSDGNSWYRTPFDGCTSLKSITVDEGVTSIPKHAFRYQTSLEEVILPNSLTSIGVYAFDGCIHISELNLPDSVKRIESYAFYGCRGFRMLNLNDDLEYIGNYAFYGCDGLLSLVLNENLVTLSDRSFGSCANLSAARVPRSVTSFAQDSFYNCPKLKIYCYKDSATHQALENTSYNFYLLDDHEHDYEVTIETEATCTRGGSQVKTCKDCGYNFIELVEPLGHDYQCVVTPPTCTERGYATYTCSRCQDSYVDDYTNPTGHSYGEWIVDTQATCQQEGSKHRICSACSHRDIGTIPKTDHDYTTEVVPPTCTEQGYTLHTCKDCSTSFKDNYVEATGHSFGEWIVDEEATCQRMGSKHRVCSKCGKQQVDTIPRTEHNYQGEVIAPTCTEQGYTLHKCSICGVSYRDTFVDAKGHTFGEWIVDKEATVLNEGKKHHVCGVCGKTEEGKIEKVSVDVENNPDYGMAVFTVVNAQTKEPISGGGVFISTETEGEATFFTDAEGHVQTVLPVGTHMISAYADGCLTRNLKIKVTPGINNIPQIGLSNQKTYTAEVTHHLMDLEEIEEAGIDTSAVDNQHVYKYELKLEFQPEIDWISLFYYMGDTGQILGGGGTGVAPGGGGGGGSSSGERTGIVWIPPASGGSSGGHFYIPPTETEPATTVYPVSEHFYLIIRGEVRWLKEMFDVEMLVVNNSMTDTLENLNATLEIPEGLSLATMKETQQDLSQELGSIAEGEQKSAHWYVRGDTAGSYNIGARLQGMIMPFEEPIDDYYEAQNPLHVWAGNALHLHFEFPDAAYYGEDYPITITLENVSDITLYNISHAVQIEQGMEIFYSDGTSKSRIERSQWETVGVKEFHPGDKIIIEASVNIFFKSEMMEKKLEQWIGFVDDVEQLMNAFKMLKTAYSATESLINCVSGCSRALDGFVASAGTSADKVELFKQLHGKISGLMLSYSKSGNKTLDAAVKLANSGVSASLNAITDNPDEWLKNHSVNDIKKLIKNVESLENSITNNSGQSARFDIYDSIRTAISAIPVKFALKSVTMTEDKNNTTSIPWSYSISNSGAHYFGVSNVSKYLSSIAKAAMAEIYESETPGYLQLIPGLDDPFNKDEVISYVKATENEIAQFQAKGATGKVTFHSWVERKNPVQPLLLNNVQPKFNLLATPTSDFLLSCDNETATFENGVLTFTGDGVISVTPQSGYDGTLYIQDSDGNLYTYEMDVVPEHTCCATEEEIVIPPTAEYDGFAVKRCDTCGDVLEIIPLVNEQLCSEHSFGEWKIDTEPTSTECGIRERNCTVCGYTEYETVDTVSHTFGEWHVTKPATCSEEGEESATCEDCGEVITRAIAKLAHTEGMWQIVKEPTATEEGEKQLACSVCGEVLKTEVIPKLENGIVIGDVNNDGNVDSVDAALLSSYLESKISLTNYQKISADINRDRILNQEDVTLILQYYALGKNGDYAGLSDLAGDVNGDGDTNISDATCIQRALAEYFDFTELDAIIADVNGDGIANISDVTALQRYLAEIEKNICVSQVNVLPYSVRTDRVLKLGVGESSELNVRILPLSLNDFNLIWTSSDETVATVSSDGIIKAVGMGTAQITIKVQNGPKTSCNVLVNENSDYTFTQNEDDTITITGYTGSETSLIIPSTIYGKTVKSIAANAFKNNTQITNIEVSNGISSIGESAFAYCSKLESVTLPDSVIEIGRAVMRGCVKLTQVNLSEGLTVLPDHAIENCVLLSQIELPSNLKEIGSRAFMNCKTLDNISLPQYLTTIGEYAFDSCEKLRNISIPDSVTSIENSAFGYCTALTSIALPPEITTIAAHLFNHSGIASITIPNKVKKIEDYAFFSCSNLANVALPDSLTNIGKYAFCSCSTLTSISIPNGVTYIGDSAFSDCSGLTSITIPDSVTSIGSHAFYACSALTNITIPDGITSIEMYTFYGCSGLSSITIPNSVTSIGKSAFCGCSGFSSVIIPDSVTTIGEHSFASCQNLKSIVFLSPTLLIADAAFENSDGLEHVLLATGSDCWDQYTIGIQNDSLTNATRHYGSNHEESTFSECGKEFEITESCSACGYVIGHKTEKFEHCYMVSETVAPTCTEQGYTTYKCSNCGDSYQSDLKNPLGHQYNISIVSPTYEEQGYDLHKCVRCEYSYRDNYTDMLIKAERIDIENEVYLYSGNSYQLNAKIYPQNTSDNTMLWSSNKTSVATVDNNGYVTAVSAGIATITVTNFDQSVISVCEIKVSQVVSYIESGTYCLKLKGTNSYLDHQGGNANGMNVHLWSGDGSSNPNQKIKIDRIDDNRHMLWSVTSTDLLIDVNRGNSYDDPLKIGLNVDLWKNNDWQAQEWLFTKTYDGYYIIRLNMLQDGALEASGVDNGANIYFGSFDLNNDMQKWELVNTSDYAVEETTAWVYNTAEIGNVHVRNGPGTNYSSIGGFNEAQQITVIGNTSAEWLKVRGINRHDGTIIQGYTHRDYVRFN